MTEFYIRGVFSASAHPNCPFVQSFVTEFISVTAQVKGGSLSDGMPCALTRPSAARFENTHQTHQYHSQVHIFRHGATNCESYWSQRSPSRCERRQAHALRLQLDRSKREIELALDAQQLNAFGLGREHDGGAAAASTPGSTRAVHVGRGGCREFEVQHPF